MASRLIPRTRASPIVTAAGRSCIHRPGRCTADHSLTSSYPPLVDRLYVVVSVASSCSSSQYAINGFHGAAKKFPESPDCSQSPPAWRRPSLMTDYPAATQCTPRIPLFPGNSQRPPTCHSPGFAGKIPRARAHLSGPWRATVKPDDETRRGGTYDPWIRLATWRGAAFMHGPDIMSVASRLRIAERARPRFER
ncbi:hypothetical protein C8Q77DRAFT_476702 [Trametes polyzona]|nr:hypothetical protein C8Q77DRAFT_476702 [Trametes polyzona]